MEMNGTLNMEARVPLASCGRNERITQNGYTEGHFSMTVILSLSIERRKLGGLVLFINCHHARNQVRRAPNEVHSRLSTTIVRCPTFL